MLGSIGGGGTEKEGSWEGTNGTPPNLPDSRRLSENWGFSGILRDSRPLMGERKHERSKQAKKKARKKAVKKERKKESKKARKDKRKKASKQET